MYRATAWPATRLELQPDGRVTGKHDGIRFIREPSSREQKLLAEAARDR